MTALPVAALSLTFAFPPAELSPNSRKHWAAKARVVADYRRDCRVVGLVARGTQRKGYPLPIPVTATVTFVLPDRRHRDMDNLLASIKPLWDGLVDAKVLAGDSFDMLRIILREPVVGPRREVRVELR